MATGNNSDFIKCPNGHLYPKSKGQCPFCPKTGSKQSKGPTKEYPKPGDDGGTKERIGTVNNLKPPVDNSFPPGQPPYNSGGTCWGNEQSDIRYYRKLTGVLFTRDIDNMGVVLNLFEGRNLIGRNDDNCNIKVITDPLMSGKHALLLFRGEQFILRDEMSTHGTFVNDEDIATDPYILKDGDVIRMGNTRFLFRSFM